MADELGLFDMASFSFDTPPADYSDATPGLLLDFGDETGPSLKDAEVSMWLRPVMTAAGMQAALQQMHSTRLSVIRSSVSCSTGSRQLRHAGYL